MTRKSGSRFRGYRGADFRFHLIDRDEPLAGEMAAAFGKFLILEMTTGEPRTFQLVDCASDILRSAEAGIGIDDRRNFHRLRHETGERRDFVEREQSDIR